MLRLDDIHFRYNAGSEKYRFNLTVEKGVIAAISGRSGSGKSTLLDLVAGFLEPTAGHIYWAETDITSFPPDKRPVTTLFQKNNLFEHRNALDNVVVGVDPKIPATGVSVDRARAALASVGLADYTQQRVSTLSGGQQQRVAIARALVRPAPLILLDEPFSALDLDTRNEMLALVRQIANNEDRCILMVTHDISDCNAIADVHYSVESGVLELVQ